MSAAASQPAAAIETRIARYLATQLGAESIELNDVQQIAVGWSHETWLFDAHWTADGGDHSRGLVPAARPRQRAAATHVRPEDPVQSAAVPRRHECAGAEAVLVRRRPRGARRAVPGDGEGAWRLSEPLGSPRSTRSTKRLRPEARCRAASPTRSQRCIPSTGRRLVSTSSACRNPEPISFAGRSPSGES